MRPDAAFGEVADASALDRVGVHREGVSADDLQYRPVILARGVDRSPAVDDLVEDLDVRPSVAPHFILIPDHHHGAGCAEQPSVDTLSGEVHD